MLSLSAKLRLSKSSSVGQIRDSNLEVAFRQHTSSSAIKEVIAPIPEAVASEHALSTGFTFLNYILIKITHHQVTPYNTRKQTPIISHDVEEDNHEIEVTHIGNDPYFASAYRKAPKSSNRDLSVSKRNVHTGSFGIREDSSLSYALTAFADADHAGLSRYTS
ncbi:hypothetical protein Tco_1103900 [Tanacetum coccineum]